MLCEKCGNCAKVVESGRDLKGVYRKRKCFECGYVFYTHEKADSKSKFKLRRLRNKAARGVENELHS